MRWKVPERSCFSNNLFKVGVKPFNETHLSNLVVKFLVSLVICEMCIQETNDFIFTVLLCLRVGGWEPLFKEERS